MSGLYLQPENYMTTTKMTDGSVRTTSEDGEISVYGTSLVGQRAMKAADDINDVLLPCPFCGGKPHLANTHSASYWVECGDCEAQVHGPSRTNHPAAMQAAAELWNHRA